MHAILNRQEKFITMKKSKLFLFFALVVLAFSSTSCITTKQVRYLQDMPIEGMPLNEVLEATIAPYDELRIVVLSNTGKDDELIKPFNVMGGNVTNMNNCQRQYPVPGFG